MSEPQFKPVAWRKQELGRWKLYSQPLYVEGEEPLYDKSVFEEMERLRDLAEGRVIPRWVYEERCDWVGAVVRLRGFEGILEIAEEAERFKKLTKQEEDE